MSEAEGERPAAPQEIMSRAEFDRLISEGNAIAAPVGKSDSDLLIEIRDLLAAILAALKAS